MTKCGNCGATLNCGCKKRKASDGKECCTGCLGNYERSLKSTVSPAPDSGVRVNKVTVTRNKK